MTLRAIAQKDRERRSEPPRATRSCETVSAVPAVVLSSVNVTMGTRFRVSGQVPRRGR